MSPRYALFISHSHRDRDIADTLVDLLHKYLFEQDSKNPRHPIYYTSQPGSLRFGQDFSTILDNLRESDRVIALVTPNSKYAPTVLAEMAIAFDNGKFIPMAVGFCPSERLSWPLDNQQICFLDSKDNVLALLSQLRQHFGIDGELPPQAAKACDALVNRAVLAHPLRAVPPPPNPRVWAARAAAVLIPFMLLGGYLLYQAGIVSGRQPRYFSINLGTPTPVGDTTVHLVYSGTFPAKFLSKRLYEFHEAREQFHNKYKAELEIQPPAEDETRRLFLDAIASAMPGILGEQQSRMKALVNKWNVGVRPWGDQKDACNQLRQNLDQEWCALIDQLKSNGDQSLRSRFDKTPFAILRAAKDSEMILTPRESVSLARISLKSFAISPEIRDNDYDLPGAVILQEDHP